MIDLKQAFAGQVEHKPVATSATSATSNTLRVEKSVFIPTSIHSRAKQVAYVADVATPPPGVPTPTAAEKDTAAPATGDPLFQHPDGCFTASCNHCGDRVPVRWETPPGDAMTRRPVLVCARCGQPVPVASCHRVQNQRRDYDLIAIGG